MSGNRKIKLIASDIDGTLLDTEKKVTPEVRRAIAVAKEAQIIFTIASGRSIVALESFLDLVSADAPVITYNGAKLVKSGTREVIYKQELSYENAMQVFEIGKELDATMVAWVNDEVYSSKQGDMALKYKEFAGRMPKLIEDYEALARDGISKILWCEDPEFIAKVPQQLEGCISHEITYCTSMPFFLEFMDSRVSKAAALEAICKIYGFDRSEIAAVGDGLNDLEMIEYAGMGVAMGNACSEVKSCAQLITGTNDENGLARAIYQIVEWNKR